MKCTKCRKEIVMEGGIFCPYCGTALSEKESEPTGEEKIWLRTIRGESNPVKKHIAIESALSLCPDSLPIHEEALYLGRLYLRDGKHLDYSLIKCYLLQLYLTPETFPSSKKEEMRAELFHDPELETCIRLSGLGDNYLQGYLRRLSAEFIRLFLKGSTYYTKSFFGFRLERRLEKSLAEPACTMIRNMHNDDQLTPKEWKQLSCAFYHAFEDELGDGSFLNEQLAQIGLSIEDEGGDACNP